MRNIERVWQNLWVVAGVWIATIAIYQMGRIISDVRGSSNIQKAKDIMASRPQLLPAIIAAIMLFIGIFPLTYGYYQFLRWIICGIAVFIAYKAYIYKKAWVAIVFCVVAILFVPIFTIHFEKDIWQLIDGISGAVFITSIFLLREPVR